MRMPKGLPRSRLQSKQSDEQSLNIVGYQRVRCLHHPVVPCEIIILLAATAPGVSLTKSTMHKTENRFAAETSVRSMAAYLVTIIVNHFVPANDTAFKIPKDIGPSAKELHEIVNRYFGISMCAVKPQYVTSTDDTTVFAIEGIIKDKPSRVETSWLFCSGTQRESGKIY